MFAAPAVLDRLIPPLFIPVVVKLTVDDAVEEDPFKVPPLLINEPPSVNTRAVPLLLIYIVPLLKAALALTVIFVFALIEEAGALSTVKFPKA